LEQLFPEQGPLEADDAYRDLRLAELAPPNRPYVIANMIASVDGRATVGGRSGELGSDTDRKLFGSLRGEVDAVMAGTATIEIENYGPLIRDAALREQRRARGLQEIPWAVTATRSMELPAQARLFQDPDSHIIVLTSSEREPPPCPATLTVERVGDERLDFVAGMERLRVAHGIRSLLLEGGPTLLGAMTAAGVVDELFLTRSPKLVEGGEPTILEGPELAAPIDLELLSLLRDGSYLFARYRLG
jgi:riboflavin biosynthesis pyrimidine reductase